MESFFRTHQYLIDHVNSPIKRQLINEIDWNQRLIGIKGSRGVGKTTFLLEYAKKYHANSRTCLYVNLNNFYFTKHSLVEFAGKFVENGGKILLLDQIFKYENWSKELRKCYDLYPTLQIVFSGSSVMRLKEENPDIRDVVAAYKLNGFSFREFLNLQTGTNFESFKLDDILKNHARIAREITEKADPVSHFHSYLHHGYYPFFLENRNFSENLVKTMNMMIEVDILLIKQIELKYLSKIRKLLYIIMNQAIGAPNVSHMSTEINTSRATIMNYIKYLKEAQLLNSLYPVGEEYPKKPSQLYVHNTNLLHAANPGKVTSETEHKTFLLNALQTNNQVNINGKNADFLVDEKIKIKYENNIKQNKKSTPIYAAVDGIEVGENNNIPLWLFGFMY